jgi:hypothetical protein
MDALKPFNSKIGNIDNEVRFLYKIRRSGPWCGGATFCIKFHNCGVSCYFLGDFFCESLAKSTEAKSCQIVVCHSFDFDKYTCKTGQFHLKSIFVSF